jgi:hypothetical protein
MADDADLSPGARVRLSHPENPAHFRRGLTGVVRELGVYQAPAPRAKYGKEPKPAPPPRAWLWVDFPGCPRNGDRPFGSFLWAEEVSTAAARSRPLETAKENR